MKTPKKKRAKPSGKRYHSVSAMQSGVTEERILQISNDVSENIHNPVKAHEWREVVSYWQQRADYYQQGAALLLPVSIALDLLRMAPADIKAWKERGPR